MHRTIADGSHTGRWMMSAWIRRVRTWLTRGSYRPERHYMRGGPSRNASA